MPDPEEGHLLSPEPARAAVLGSPVAHSLSPTLHEAAYRALGLTGWTYAACQVDASGLPGFVAGLDATWRGLSLTMPLKAAALVLADTASPTAREAGAANTLVHRPEGGWNADNTDVVGLARSLTGVDHGGSATVLGAGATARSAVLALRSLGVTKVAVAARRAEAAVAVAAWAAGLDQGPVAVTAVPLDRWCDGRTRLVVSTLPPAAGPLAADVLDGAGSSLDGVTLLDVVYAGWPTPLARAAQRHGIATVNGLDMLVHQAAEQVRLFTGLEPPLAVMFDAVDGTR